MEKRWNGKDLLSLGFKEGEHIGILLTILETSEVLRERSADDLMLLLKALRDQPEQFLEDPVLKEAAGCLIRDQKQKDRRVSLRAEALPYISFGTEHIDRGALEQMNTAMRLPATVAGALMPDAHQGYGLPIGGVLATRNAVIPYGVGVDIGCRMALSVLDIPEIYLESEHTKLKRELIARTQFGAGNGFSGNQRAQHSVLDRPEFNMTPFIRQLHDKAYAQLGSSGGGNHFAEWGIIEFRKRDELLDIDSGRYLALLTHSGSRGLGATIAGHYTRLAKSICQLPKEAANLAYLDMNSEAGREYWIAMNLAGDYAAACHEVIHNKLVKAIGGQVLIRVENHHNFAWKETWNGEEVIVHRKGATPAARGVMGIIPGSMTAPGFLVRGKGVPEAISSASHGAGRLISRSQAIKTLTTLQLRSALQAAGVSLTGAGLDEAPMAYKDIHAVMAAQKALVDIVATFTPRIVRMAEDGSRED